MIFALRFPKANLGAKIILGMGLFVWRFDCIELTLKIAFRRHLDRTMVTVPDTAAIIRLYIRIVFAL